MDYFEAFSNVANGSGELRLPKIEQTHECELPEVVRFRKQYLPVDTEYRCDCGARWRVTGKNGYKVGWAKQTKKHVRRNRQDFFDVIDPFTGMFVPILIWIPIGVAVKGGSWFWLGVLVGLLLLDLWSVFKRLYEFSREGFLQDGQRYIVESYSAEYKAFTEDGVLLAR